MRTYVSTFLFAFLLILPLSAQAQHVLSFGPKAGEKIPSDLSDGYDKNSLQTNFDALKGENGMVLMFVRSVEWCPYCQSQLIHWNNYVTQFDELGYTLVGLSYDTPAKTFKFSEKHKLNYMLVSDPNSRIIRKFGILNEEMRGIGKFYGVPYPYIYVIDTDGIIQERYAEDNYKKRPAAIKILENLRAEMKKGGEEADKTQN